MSFSKDVKEELSKICNLANKKEIKNEFLGYLSSNNIMYNSKICRFSTENDYNIDRFTKLCRNVGIEDFEISVNGKLFFVEIEKDKLINLNEFNYETENVNDLKAFIRGVFMGSGSINNPEKKYNLEFTLKNQKDLDKILNKLKQVDIYLKERNNTLYTKDGEEISKFLAFIGANKSVLKFEEIRVQRQMNNKVNRLVNCESANFNKILNASVEQVEAIKKLKQSGRFEKLDEGLKEVAELRLEYPDIPLQELGKKLSEPIGKSGVNYRLKKIIKIASEE